MKRFLLVIGIITFIGLLCTKAWAQSNQKVNNGSLTAAVNFLPGGCTYNWVNNAPDIGLPAKGTGNILPFTALNAGASPVVATITATAQGSCAPVTFTITVNPTIPTITTGTTPLNVNTVYGTPSAPAKFITSGMNLQAGVLVTPPKGFEVSTDNVSFSPTVSLNSANAQLSYLYLDPDVARTSPAGSDDTFNASVDNSVQSIKITPVAASASSTIKINGVAVANATASAPVNLSPGANTINITITAQNGITTKSYTVNITRAGSSDATLAGLITNQGSISPSFSPDVLSYTTTVYNSAISITPTTTNSDATVKINGIQVASGTASANIALSNANNVIPIVVTAQDGVTTKTYNLTVISTKSSNAGLAQLSLSPVYTLTRITGTTNYFTTVPSNVSTVQLIAVTSDANASIKMNGVAVTSGKVSPPITLNASSTAVNTVITAQDGVSTQTYIVTINKTSPSNTGLSKLSITPVSTLTAVPNTNNYVTTVSPTVTIVQETVAASDDNATVKVNGIAVASGATSPPIPLNAAGSTTVTTVVTAANGVTTKTYTITINKNGASNTVLSGLSLSLPATISQVLGTTNYTTSVSPAVTSLQLKITLADANATLKINGATATSGTLSPPITLNATGNTDITTVVTAQDGVTKQTFVLTISKNGATNTGITQILFNPGVTLKPVPGTTNYTTSVSANITSLQQSVIPADANATVKINGVAVLPGVASNPIALNATGTTDITTVVTAQDGVTKRTIVITVSKNGSTNTAIGAISLSPDAALTLIPGTSNYTTSVISTVNTVQQTLLPDDPNATITVNGLPVAAGMPSAPILLNPTGPTDITTIITAPDGISTKTYTVTINKNGATNTDINQIYLTPSATLTPVAGTNNFVASIGATVNSVQQTIITADANASAVVNGVPVASGGASNPVLLNATGSTVITTVITAQDGATTTTYTVIITRGSNGDLLSPLTADLPPTPVYIRLAATTPAGTYNGDVVLSSTNAGDARVPMKNCVVSAAPLTVTTANVTKSYGTALTDEPASTKYTISSGALQNGNTLNSVKLTYAGGAAANATAGNYPAAIVPSAAAGGNGFLPANYNITYVPANITVVPVKLTIKADNLSKDFGVANPPLTITYTGFVNSEGPVDLLTQPVISTTAVTRSTVGKYPITVNGAESPNYVFTYVPGILTVSAEHLSIFIPNTITPNGDGINDTWNIRDVDAYPNTTIDVFNRQGQKVFTSIGYGTAWDGTYHGSPLPTGTYYYFIKNNTTVMSGNLTIIR